MNRIERCENTLAFHEVDRAATYIPSISCEVATRILGREAHTGTGSLHFAEVNALAKGKSAHQDFVARHTEDLIAIHEALNIDVLRHPWRMTRKPLKVVDNKVVVFGDPNGYREIWRYETATGDFAMIDCIESKPPLEDRIRESLDQVEKEGETYFEQRARDIIKPVKHLREAAGAEAWVVGAGTPFGIGFGEEELILLITDPGLVAEQMMIQGRLTVALARELVRENLPLVIMGGLDLASQSGVLYSPKSFREVMLPAFQFSMKQLNAMQVHYLFRSDGNIWEIVDMLFREASCPGYGEVDRDAGMMAGKIREQFPALVLWGNASSARLAQGNTDSVRTESQSILEEVGGRGYFHGCSNSIVSGTSVENVETLYSIR